MFSLSMKIKVIKDSFECVEVIPHINLNKVPEGEEMQSKELEDPSVEAPASMLE